MACPPVLPCFFKKQLTSSGGARKEVEGEEERGGWGGEQKSIGLLCGNQSFLLNQRIIVQTLNKEGFFPNFPPGGGRTFAPLDPYVDPPLLMSLVFISALCLP